MSFSDHHVSCYPYNGVTANVAILAKSVVMIGISVDSCQLNCCVGDCPELTPMAVLAGEDQ